MMLQFQLVVEYTLITPEFILKIKIHLNRICASITAGKRLKNGGICHSIFNSAVDILG